MIIDNANGNIINTQEVNIHDDSLLLLEFDRQQKRLVLKIEQYQNIDNVYNIVFLNVLGFEMSSCDFWGASECIFGFEYVEKSERKIIPTLQNRWCEIPDFPPHPSYENYIETKLTFSSGDYLQIACEKIEFCKNSL